MGQDKNNRKTRKWEQLKERERYQIEGLLKAGQSITAIARQLGRDRRTIQREIARGRVVQVDYLWRERQEYLADVGQRIKEKKASHKGRTLKIGYNHALCTELEKLIVKKKFSPDAALGWLRKNGKEDMVTVCTKTIYNYIDMGLFMGITNKDLPVKRNSNEKRRTIRRTARNHQGGKSIEQRPDEVEERINEGHWEMDCVLGQQGTKASLLVLTERKSAVELIYKLENKTQECVLEVLDGLEEQHGERFAQMFKSITVDNGGEFLSWERLERSIRSQDAIRTRIYYAHPYCAWERGSNENQNKLIRRFIPKGTDIGKLNQNDVKRIQYWMNHYPRRRFGYKSPYQVSNLNVA